MFILQKGIASAKEMELLHQVLGFCLVFVEKKLWKQLLFTHPNHWNHCS